MDALDQGHRCGRCQGESEEGVDPVAPKKSFVFFFLFQKKMNGKELAEMWNNMEEEGTNMYREEEGGEKEIFGGGGEIYLFLSMNAESVD